MNVLTAVLAVFMSVAEWIGTALQALEPIFWDGTDNHLTFFGVLSVSSLAFAVVFMVLGIIQGFLHFRG